MIKTSRDRRPYDGLTPDTVLAAVESVGLLPDRRLFALNSYENRVYRLGLEMPLPGEPRPGEIVADVVIAKFYRDGRWSDAQMREEHEFGRELADAELPVAAPLSFEGRRCTGTRASGSRCSNAASAPRRNWTHPTRAPCSGAPWGACTPSVRASHSGTRRGLGSRGWGVAAREEVLAARSSRRTSRGSATRRLCRALLVALIRDAFDGHPIRDSAAARRLPSGQRPVERARARCSSTSTTACRARASRTCGCSFRRAARRSPSARSGRRSGRLRAVRDFDFREVALIEPLRALRMIEHAAWLVRSAGTTRHFPRAFPWFGEPRYWERTRRRTGRAARADAGSAPAARLVTSRHLYVSGGKP
jgi:hypothetical protein